MGNQTIKVKVYSNVIEEYYAGETIHPGNLMEVRSDKKAYNHGIEGGSVLPLFALACELAGETIDDEYSANDLVFSAYPYRGDIILARLTGAEVDAGDFLMSAGDGTLEKFEAETANATLEAKDGDNGFYFKARTPGYGGNALQVLLEGDGETTKGSETVTVTTDDGITTIKVEFRNEATESTIADVISAIQGDTDADELVMVEAVGTDSEEAFEVNESLSGGKAANTGQTVAKAEENVDPDGVTKWVKARII